MGRGWVVQGYDEWLREEGRNSLHSHISFIK